MVWILKVDGLFVLKSQTCAAPQGFAPLLNLPCIKEVWIKTLQNGEMPTKNSTILRNLTTYIVSI